MNKRYTVQETYDGFYIMEGEEKELASWDHNDPSPGFKVYRLLKKLGLDVEYEEII